MSLARVTRRGFLKTACIVTGGVLFGIRLTGRALAAAKQIKDYMLDRINGVYGADASFPVRASQDNAQVKRLYADFLEKPLSHASEKLLHTTWFDKSGGFKALAAKGVFPNPRQVTFDKSPYPYE